MFRSVQGYLFRHASVRTVFYPSKFVRDYLEKAEVQQEKMMNLRRGVDCNMFHPSKRSDEARKRLAPNGETILVTVARLAPEKGFAFLAECVKKLDGLGVPFKLLVVGGNRNSQVEQDVKNLFGDMIEEEKVSFAGFLKGDELAMAYACGDIFLHCSITETFGLVVLESMASGVPVIARDEGGPSEIVVDEKSGYLIPPDGLNNFVEKIVSLSNDLELRVSMGFESRRLAEAQTWDKIGNQVALKMAQALDEDEPASMPRDYGILGYSWLILSKRLRGFVDSVLWEIRLMPGLGIIIGVWGGLVITWILVQIALFIIRLRKISG